MKGASESLKCEQAEMWEFHNSKLHGRFRCHGGVTVLPQNISDTLPAPQP